MTFVMTSKVGLIRVLASPLVLSAQPASSARYVGSAACQQCHSEIYARWKKTRMANVARDPKEYPGAITPDLTKPDPLLTFTKEDIAFVYGSGSSATSSGSGTTTIHCLLNGTSRTRCGVPTSLRTARIGGPNSIQLIICSAPPARFATAVIPSTTTLRPRRSRNGTLVAKSAMDRAPITCGSLCDRIS